MKNIPTHHDLHLDGYALLYTSWEQMIDYLNIILFDNNYGGNEAEKKIVFYENLYVLDKNPIMKRKLATSFVLAQQGAELLLKSKICSVSPMLLLSKSSLKNYESSSSSESLSFSDLTTINAGDLIKTYNKNCSEELPNSLTLKFNEFRKHRNSFSHFLATPSIGMVRNLMEYILLLNDVFGGGVNFLHKRKLNSVYLDHIIPEFFEFDLVLNLQSEFNLAIRFLDEQKVKRFFGINIDKELIFCETCNGCEEIETAQIIDDHTYCPICTE